MIEGLDKLRRLSKELKQLENNLPRKLGNIAVNFYKDSFRRQGFIENTSVEKWKPRQQRAVKGRRVFRPGATLVKSGRLRRSIKVTRLGPGFAEIGTDVPYARAHNEGETINQSITITPKMRKFFWAMYFSTKDTKYKMMALKRGKIHRTVKMPKRQFMGLSNFLEKRFEKNLEFEIETLLKKVL